MSTDEPSVQAQHIHYYALPDYTFWLGEDGEVWMPREFTGFEIVYGTRGG